MVLSHQVGNGLMASRAEPTSLLQGPMNLMRDGYNKHGEVFTVPVLHKRITFLLGPHVTTHFFKAPDDEMSQTEVQIARIHDAPSFIVSCPHAGNDAA